MKLNRSSTSAGDAINLTPLIDIVFLLLIFFMVTASFKEDERDLKVILPGAENANPIKDLPKIMHVSVRKNGDFFVGNVEFAERQLGGDANVPAIGSRSLEEALRERWRAAHSN